VTISVGPLDQVTILRTPRNSQGKQECISMPGTLPSELLREPVLSGTEGAPASEPAPAGFRPGAFEGRFLWSLSFRKESAASGCSPTPTIPSSSPMRSLQSSVHLHTIQPVAFSREPNLIHHRRNPHSRKPTQDHSDKERSRSEIEPDATHSVHRRSRQPPQEE
jgi:hypothetical protein